MFNFLYLYLAVTCNMFVYIIYSCTHKYIIHVYVYTVTLGHQNFVRHWEVKGGFTVVERRLEHDITGGYYTGYYFYFT